MTEQQTVDEKGLRAARAVAGWYLGYRSWAELLINAYLNPDEAMKNLREAKGEHGIEHVDV